MRQARQSILSCPSCGQLLRIPRVSGKTLAVVCPKCRRSFDHSWPAPRHKGRVVALAEDIVAVLLLGCMVTAVFFAKYANGANDVKAANRLLNLKAHSHKQLDDMRKAHATRIASIDPTALQEIATQRYEFEWNRRGEFDGRYAHSARERALLRMQTVSKDRTKTADQVIEQIAREAAPRLSLIRLTHDASGRILDIDFPMSSVTGGEENTSTKHTSVESLKKEVLTLIAKTTFDVFQFCRDLDLASIRVGCRHEVQTRNASGRERVEDIILYKIRIARDDLAVLRSDPFVNRYSTSDYFRTELDDFANIEIIQVPYK